MIEFQNVSYRYAFQSDCAVKDLSFKVEAGSVLLVTGASGCGKTTLMRIANGLCPHYYAGTLSGSVKINGVETKDTSVGELSQTVGTLFQDPEDQFFALGVKDEMGFALKVAGVNAQEVDERIQKVAQRLEMESLLSHSITALSEGQKQRVALGEILVALPKVLILDEPSANLDPEATERLAQELKNLKSQGFAILVVDHRIHWLRGIADQVLVMREGEICQRGDFELLTNDAVRCEYGLRDAYVEDVRKTLDQALDDTPILVASSVSFDYEKNNQSGGFSRIKRFFKTSEKVSHRAELLKNISFSLGTGITALIGENGTGKTTLARLMTGLNEGSGTFYLKGKETKASDLLKHAGLVLQNADHQLQMQTVSEEIGACLFAAGQRDHLQARIDELMQTFDLTPLAQRHPQSLSGGQKQRLVIACALAKDPDILILDEPTSGLDGANMQRVARCLNDQAQKGKAILLITHDLELLQLCAQHALRMDELKKNF